MRLLIAAVGRLKTGPETQLLERYIALAKGAGRPVGIGPILFKELIEAKGQSPAIRKADEAERLVETSRQADLRIALDEHGKIFDSRAFSDLLAKRRDAGVGLLAFLIGGADGHGEAALGACHLKLSLGPMTLPHGLARIVLAEQIYRAVTIMTGHPYHRG